MSRRHSTRLRRKSARSLEIEHDHDVVTLSSFDGNLLSFADADYFDRSAMNFCSDQLVLVSERPKRTRFIFLCAQLASGKLAPQLECLFLNANAIISYDSPKGFDHKADVFVSNRSPQTIKDDFMNIKIRTLPPRTLYL